MRKILYAGPQPPCAHFVVADVGCVIWDVGCMGLCSALKHYLPIISHFSLLTSHFRAHQVSAQVWAAPRSLAAT